MVHPTPNGKDSPTRGFDTFGLSQSTLEALRKVGYEKPSPIQAAFLPLALNGRDAIGQARTGTGKTAAFVIPILERIADEDAVPQALVLAPTRELSQQVLTEAERLAAGRPLRSVCLVGGKPLGRQIDELKRGVHLVVGTPGRILDHLRRRSLDLKAVKIVVLDEADRMLDIGFRPDIERILRRCPRRRQTLLLSATMPAPVQRLAERYMQNPERVDLSGDDVTVDNVRQYYVTVDPDRKFGSLVRLLLQERPKQVLVFTRTKRGAERLYRRFAGRLPRVAVIHGDLQQRQRDRVMQQFRSGKIRMLIATDVVGRGIDISGISHIINYDIPEYCDDYVHRVGRTGRLSSEDESGYAFTFVSRDEGQQLTNIEMRINRLLEAYHIEGYETHRPVPPRKRVEDESDSSQVPEYSVA